MLSLVRGRDQAHVEVCDGASVPLISALPAPWARMAGGIDNDRFARPAGLLYASLRRVDDAPPNGRERDVTVEVRDEHGGRVVVVRVMMEIERIVPFGRA
jgi:hypothetical protein